MAPYDLIAYVVRIFETLEIPYFITGSIASTTYGEPRFTNDIDVVAIIDEQDIKKLLESFPQEEFYLSEEAIRDALKHRYQFNIIHPASGFKIDVMVSKNDSFDRSRFNRIKRLKLPVGLEINMASPEDVIIKKMEYYREGSSEKHIRDILSILRVSSELIDMSYIRAWAIEKGLQELWKELEAENEQN